MIKEIDFKQLALKFSELLQEELTPEEFDEVNKRNATPEYSQCCASHDFRDANMIMLEALESLGGTFDETMADPTVWNMAWDLAKRCEFNETFIKNSGIR